VSKVRLLNEDSTAVEGCQRPTEDPIEAHGVEVELCEEAERKPIWDIRHQPKNNKRR
jgi:hypothetical protein